MVSPFLLAFMNSLIIRTTVKEILQKTAESKRPRGHLDPDSFDRHIQFQTYAPPLNLAPFLEHFWTIEWDIPMQYDSRQVMHRPYVDIFISLEESGIQGTFRGAKTYKAEGRGRIVGARFLPGAFHGFWVKDMSDLLDGNIDLTVLLPEFNQEYIIKLMQHNNEYVVNELTSALCQRLPEIDENIALLGKMIAAIERDEGLRSVRAVAKQFGRSERWLQQFFQDYIGIGLKWFLQRHKLLAAAKQIRDAEKPNWSAIAYDLGYSSQQHFITDFKKIFGMTPLRYKKSLDIQPIPSKTMI
jgi:AraC-like DNA-binding protein